MLKITTTDLFIYFTKQKSFLTLEKTCLSTAILKDTRRRPHRIRLLSQITPFSMLSCRLYNQEKYRILLYKLFNLNAIQARMALSEHLDYEFHLPWHMSV